MRPSNEAEVLLGSSTVSADGSPMSYAGLPVLSCQDIGVPPPKRARRKHAVRSLMLPTSFVLPIPVGKAVLIGGTPTIALTEVEDLLLRTTKRLRGSIDKAKGPGKRARTLKGAKRRPHPSAFQPGA